MTSFRQIEENRKYVNEGFQTIKLPLRIKKYRVSKSDGHLNCEANNQVMQSLADTIITKGK